MKNTQLEPVFRKHKTKIILFKMLFRNRKFYIENGQFYYDGTLFEDLDLEALADTDKTIYRDYMDKRNDCLLSPRWLPAAAAPSRGAGHGPVTSAERVGGHG